MDFSVLDNVDPCCGVPLKRATKFIAMIDLVNAGGTATFIGFMFIVTLFYGDEIQDDFSPIRNATDSDSSDDPDMNGRMGTGIILWFLFLAFLVSVLYALLAKTLLHGAQQKDIEKVSRWFHISVVLLCLRIMGLTFAMLSTKALGFLMIWTAYTLYTAYALWVVYRFRKELHTEEAMALRDGIRTLQTKEYRTTGFLQL